MKGQKITSKERNQMRDLAAAGIKREEIAKIMDKGYSTVCFYTKGGPKVNDKRSYSVCIDREDYAYIVKLSERKGVTKRVALSEVVRLAKRKCLFNW
jgi:IS30 family transposase